MDFHVPNELMYFSLYLTCRRERKTLKDPRNQISKAFKMEKYLLLTSLMSSLTRLAQTMSRASLVV